MRVGSSQHQLNAHVAMFELFVILKKAAQFAQGVFGQIFDFANVRISRIVFVNRYNLVVLLVVVLHLHHSNRTRGHDTHRRHRILAEH